MEAIQLIKSGLENVQRGTDRALEGMTAEEIAWHPRPDANSIGLILFHMARSEDSFVQRLIQGKKQIWETGKWYEKLGKAVEDSGSHYTPEQVADFQVPKIEDLQAYFAAVRTQTLGFLAGLTPEKLDAKVEMPQMGPPPKTTEDGKPAPPRRPPFEPIVGSLLLMNVTHLAQHGGEISYLRGLKRGMDK